MITVSIAVCTRDRPQQLQTLLDSFTHMALSADTRWELVVVDNGRRAGTRDVVQRYCSSLPIRLVHEPRPGLSVARNRALEATTGAWIAFTDDDVTVSPTWLSRQVEAFFAYPAAAFVGGPIRGEIRSISKRRLAIYRAIVPGAMVHLEPEYDSCCLWRSGWGFPWGANIAFRRDALGDLRFDPRFGRKPGRGFQIGEETRLVDALLERGQFGVWLHENRVVHHGGRSRVRRRYLRRFYYEVGWLMGERIARSDPAAQNPEIEAVLGRAESRPPILSRFLEPPAERLARLRDRSIGQGLLDGLAAAGQSRGSE